MLKVTKVATGEPIKTQSSYRGPCVIIADIGNDIYQVETMNTDETGRCFAANAHISQMKIYRNVTEDGEIEEENDEETEVDNQL
ncbi:hypothetical protein Trydic_g1640 [Trypoxylus dichotomus]